MEQVVHFDKTINLGHIISVIVFSIGGLAAYYDLKGDVKLHTTQIVAIEKTLEVDRVNQRKQDESQDKLVSQAVLDLKSVMSDNKIDIKNDLREIRNDFYRKK
jgi:hypothetical protein